MIRNKFSHKIGADIQLKLNQALMSLLYVSQRGLSFKSWMPNERIAINDLLNLHSAFEAFGKPLSMSSETKSQKAIIIESYAKILADAYCIWDKLVSQKGPRQEDLPLGRRFSEWQHELQKKDSYWPIDELNKRMQIDGNKFFLRALVHGSIATLDDTCGFSDMDLAFVVRASVLKDPDKLLELRVLAREILILTYAFDPFMHHGPYYLTEFDLNWYSEAMFPPVLFANGVELLPCFSPTKIFVRPSDEITDQMLELFRDFFSNLSQHAFDLKNSYELEWILGSALFIPVLYLQRKTGVFRYKREVIPLVEKEFSCEEWQPVRIASELRRNLGYRPKPSQFLIWCARRLRMPGLLQAWAKQHPESIRRAKAVSEIMGHDYPLKVLRLIESMKSRLGKKTLLLSN